MKTRRGVEGSTAAVAAIAIALSAGGLYFFVSTYAIVPKTSSTTFTTASVSYTTTTNCVTTTGSGFSTTFSVCTTLTVTASASGHFCIAGWCPFSIQGVSFALLASLSTVAGVIITKPPKSRLD